MENNDINAIEGLCENLENLLVPGALILADGKVNMADLPAAIQLLSNVNEVIANFKKVGEAYKEAKDLNADELKVIVDRLFAVGKKVENALAI